MLTNTEPKNQAVSKLESLIERGRSRAANVIDRVMRHQPTDRLVRGDVWFIKTERRTPAGVRGPSLETAVHYMGWS